MNSCTVLTVDLIRVGWRFCLQIEEDSLWHHFVHVRLRVTESREDQNDIKHGVEVGALNCR